jgi:hypothetical protein
MLWLLDQMMTATQVSRLWSKSSTVNLRLTLMRIVRRNNLPA